MSETTQDRDALLREGLRLVEVEVQRCERQSTEGAEPLRDSGFEGAVEEYARRARVLAAVAAVVRRELEAPGEVSDQWFSRLRCDWVLRHLYERGVDVAVAESVEAAFAVAALVSRELEAPADRDALWREYATARTDVVNADRDLRECVARAAEHRYPPAWACQDYVRRADEAWHRLDAAVRALAAAPPAEPQRIDLMEHLREFLSRRTVQECIARELVRRYGVPPEGDEGEWYPGDSWLEDADALLRMAAAPREREGE